MAIRDLLKTPRKTFSHREEMGKTEGREYSMKTRLGTAMLLLARHVFVAASVPVCVHVCLFVCTEDETRSSATAKSTARPSCLVGVLYDIYR